MIEFDATCQQNVHRTSSYIFEPQVTVDLESEICSTPLRQEQSARQAPVGIQMEEIQGDSANEASGEPIEQRTRSGRLIRPNLRYMNFE